MNTIIKNSPISDTICLNCKQPTHKSLGKFCGPKCYQEYRSKQSKIILTCPICKKQFTKNAKFITRTLQKNSKTKFYCSRKCHNISQIGRTSPTKNKKRAEYIQVKCTNCNNIFSITKNNFERKQQNKNLFCSDFCYNDYRIKHSVVDVKCDQCNKTYKISQAAYNRRLKVDPNHKFYCSKKCHNNALCKNEHRYYTKYITKCDYCGKDIIRTGWQLEQTKYPLHFCCRKHQGRYLLLLGIFTKTRSCLEEKIENYIKQNYSNINVKFNDREVCFGYELDIYFPDLKIAFEINGPLHSKNIFGTVLLKEIQKRDKLKKKICLSKHIKLIVVDAKMNYNKNNNALQIFEKYIMPYLSNKPLTPSILTTDHLDGSYTFEQCQKEYQKICSLLGNFNPIPALNKNVLTYQPHFYEIEKKLWLENPNNLRQKLVDNRRHYINKDEYTLTHKEVLRGFKISAFYKGFSHFSPLWIKKIIEDYQIKSIYDPCGGWGHRLLGSGDILYIYNDWDTRSYNGVVQMAKDLKLKNKIFYNNNCTQFTPKEDYECVFTCPPYYNIEIYQNKTFKNLDDYNDFWNSAIQKSLKPSVKWFIYVINNIYYEQTKNICLKNGLKHVTHIDLGIRHNHFQTNQIKTHREIIVIFKS